jgi:glycosyltransferase involved in cell wall biosynthesis
VLSHRTFLEGYRKYSRHDVRIWHLEPRKWKWRMRGAAMLFAGRARACGAGEAPDLVIASDFLNLSDWRAMAPRAFRDAPAILYFHENQATYPLGEQAPADTHYGWINLSSALAADRVLFNSAYHRGAFLREVARVLRLMPDNVPEGLPERMAECSDVFPVGIDLEPHEAVKARLERCEGPVPLVLWNHRWEYDKGPELLVEALRDLKASGVPFRVALCGQSFRRVPEALKRIVAELRAEFEHVGFLESQDAYLELIRRSDVVLSTAREEFFGVSVVEAMYLGCLPALPWALSYPEIIPTHLHDRFLYEGHPAPFLKRFLADLPRQLRGEMEQSAAAYHWKLLAPRLDSIVEETWERGRG